MKKLRNMPGFTVLEFLIVLAIIIILVAIALPSLERARIRSYNEKLVTDLKIIAVGLEEFKQACGEYPEKIENDTGCNPEDENNTVTLRQFIPVLHEYRFNGLGDSEKTSIFYYPFGNDQFCYGFHIGVQLRGNEGREDFYAGDMNGDSTRRELCKDFTGNSFDGSDPLMYDIIKQ